LAQEQKTPWVPGRAYRLSLACIVPDMSNYPLLDGEVNSRGTLSDVDDSSRRFSRFPFTGFVAHTAAGAPAEWKITRFVRN
jgi:hypothetical protein